MGGGRIPGTICGTANEWLDAGTMCLWRTPAPALICVAPPPVARQERRAYSQSVAGGFSPSLMLLGPEGVALLQAVEELHLQPYDDQTGDDIDAWVKGATIGYGHLITKAEWAGFEKGITQLAADELFAADLAPFEALVRSNITVGLQQYEFDALVIFAFNIGPGKKDGFPGSSVVKLVNDPKAVTPYANLEAAWKAWNKSQGKVNKGLDNRRNCEWKIFTSARYERW